MGPQQRAPESGVILSISHSLTHSMENTATSSAICTTCGSEIVETINDSNFNEGECGPCEYARYKLQPELYSVLNSLYWSHAVHDSELPERLWNRILEVIGKHEELYERRHGKAA